MERTIEYEIKKKPEEVWEKTVKFWNIRKKKKYTVHENTLYVSQGLSCRGLSYFSYGEKYKIKVYKVKENPEKTKVEVKVKLRLGTGAQWAVASDTLKEWAIAVGTKL